MKLKSLSDLSKLLSDDERKNLSSSTTAVKKSTHDGKGKSVKVFLDAYGRKGKVVTIVAGLQHNPETLEQIARTLKQYCGAGGTVKEGQIEIQGDQVQKVSEKLRTMNYAVR
jgi:translation initiation factor 1